MRYEIIMKAIPKKIAANSDTLKIIRIPCGLAS
jgi:hypothetical protein